MTIPTIRLRTRKPKTRTGCRTCKTRRIKCDEYRPSCKKCSSTGRTCDGYELGPSIVTVAASSEIHVVNTNPDPIRALAPHNPLVIPQVNLPLGMNNDESQGWDFFRSQTVNELGGCFESNLWEHLILQIGHHEPSILHAAIAVGTMHRNYKERGVSDKVTGQKNPYEVFSLRQYVKAIGSLRTRLQDRGDSRTSEISLLTCLLFICLEMLQGQRIEALTHLQTGLRILSDLNSQRRGCEGVQSNQMVLRHDPDTVIDQLRGVFGRLDYESTMFGLPSPHLHLIPEQNLEKSSTWVPATFFNIQEARQYMDTLSSVAFHFRGQVLEEATGLIPEEILDPGLCLIWKYSIARSLDLSIHPQLLSQLRAQQAGLAIWFSALRAYKDRPRSIFSDSDKKALMLLEAQHFFVSFVTASYQTTKEASSDSFNDDFERVLNLSTAYLKGPPPKSSQPSNTQPTFTIESGVLPALYLIAMKCRHPGTRRQAISALYHTTRQESMWDGPLIARFAEQVADFEERAANASRVGDGPLTASEQIPESARFLDVVVAVTEDPAWGRLICARYRHEIDGALHVWEERCPLG